MTKHWKTVEDWLWSRVKDKGWKRRGHMEQGVGCCDLENDMFSLDATTRKKIPGWIKKEMIDARVHALQPSSIKHGDNYRSKIPLVVLHEHGADRMDMLVIMRWKDFEELHI